MTEQREFDPTDFLHFAEELFEFEGAFNYIDAKIRTILGRCYYAVYLNCAFKVLGLKQEQRFNHELVYRSIKSKGELGRKIAKELDYLWIYRTAADYYPTTPVKLRGREQLQKTVVCSEKEAKDAINRAKRALEKIKDLIN